MEAEEKQDKERRRSITRAANGVFHESESIGGFTQEGRVLFQSFPVLPDPDPPAQDPTTGFIIPVLGQTKPG